jgi:membrane-associated phospholipid phosphatase
MFSDFIVGKFSFGADLFFSGHTGLPFLMALIFWKNKLLRYSFLFLSVFFGLIVLLGHIHYSIDVLSAFFITYTIWHVSEKLFPKDLQIFKSKN